MTIEVKVCGITRLEDAKASLTVGAKYLGFILYPQSPRKITIDDSKQIIENLNSFSYGKVAVDVCPTPQSVMQMKKVGFDFYQFHFPQDFDLTKICQWSELVDPSKLWLAPQIPPGNSFPEKLLELAETFVIDAFSKDKFGGTGNISDWDNFLSFKKDFPSKKWILAGGIGPQNVLQAVELTKPSVIDLNSKVESKPGIKDKGKIETIFKFISHQ